MEANILKAIEEKLQNLDNHKYPSIVENLNFEAGKIKIANMVYNKLSEFKNWNFENAISDIELTLSGLGNE